MPSLATPTSLPLVSRTQSGHHREGPALETSDFWVTSEWLRVTHKSWLSDILRLGSTSSFDRNVDFHEFSTAVCCRSCCACSAVQDLEPEWTVDSINSNCRFLPFVSVRSSSVLPQRVRKPPCFQASDVEPTKNLIRQCFPYRNCRVFTIYKAREFPVLRCFNICFLSSLLFNRTVTNSWRHAETSKIKTFFRSGCSLLISWSTLIQTDPNWKGIRCVLVTLASSGKCRMSKVMSETLPAEAA